MMKTNLKKNQIGITLIEVLLALLILSIAVTATILATTSTARKIYYLENKTLATWAGLNLIRELQTKVRTPPSKANPLIGKVNIKNNKYNWSIALTDTKNKTIKTIKTTIYGRNHTKIITLTGYLYDRK